MGNDLINAGCGDVFRVAQGGGIVARSRLDRHRTLDGVAVQIKSRDLCAIDGIIAGHVGQQLKGRAAVSVCVKGCLQISKSPPLAIVQGCFSHRGRAAVGAGSGVFVKAVLAAVGAGLYHQVAGLGSGFLQRELRVATVVSKPRFLGKQIAQCDAVIQPQTFSQNLSAVQLDFAAPNLQLEQGGAIILRIKYQCTAVPHGHSHRAVTAAAVNDRQITGASLTRGRKAADIQAVSTQAMSVQIQREGLAGIYAARQRPVCQQGDGAAICGLVKDLSQRIIGAVLSGGLHVQLVRCDTHAIGTLHPHRKRRAAASTLIVAGILVMGTRRVADVADAVREFIVGAYKAAVADVEVVVECIRVGIINTLHAMRVRHNDDVLGQLFYTSVDERARFVFCALVIFRKSKPIAQQLPHITVSIRSLYRNTVCTIAFDNRAFLQAAHQLAVVLDEQAAGKVCLALEFQRTSVLAFLIVIYPDSRHSRCCRLGNHCFIADDQLAALYIQSRSALKGQALPIHHERNGFFDRISLCITAEADRVITVQRFQHRHRAAIRNAFKGFLQFEIVLFCAIACASLCLHLLLTDGANTIFNRFMRTGQAAAGACAVLEQTFVVFVRVRTLDNDDRVRCHLRGAIILGNDSACRAIILVFGKNVACRQQIEHRIVMPRVYYADAESLEPTMGKSAGCQLVFQPCIAGHG